MILIQEVIKGSELTEFFLDVNGKEEEFKEKSKDIPLDDDGNPTGTFRITITWEE